MGKKILLLLTLLIISCSKSSSDDGNFNEELTAIDLNYYPPNISNQNVITPQLTIKDETFQVTALGFNQNESKIEKLFLSDTETETEWIVLLNNENSPVFMYGINTATNESLPYLYGVETINSGAFILRYYKYDWENRLGTLEYESQISGETTEIIYDNQNIANKNTSNDKSKNTSFKTPIVAFNNLFKNKKSANKVISSRVFNDDLDDFFDNKFNEFIDLLKDTKTKLINAPCKVSEILDKSDKNFICKMSDAINKITDEEIFGDLDSFIEEDQNETTDYSGSSIDIDFSFFDDISTENITEHINNIRDIVNNTGDSFTDWVDDLNDLMDTEEEDLNDLSDSDGVIQIGLSWDSTSDIDLHVTDPYGEEIYYSNPTSNSGGYLDRDDTDGYGPENIYWTSNIPTGNYSISLVYYSPFDGPVTDCVVKIINGLGISQSYDVSLGYFDLNKVHVVDFKVEDGNNILFQ